MIRRRHLLLVALGGVMGCTSALPHAEPSDAERAKVRWSDATMEQLQDGRAAFVVKCSGCHDLPLPKDRPPQRWSDTVQTMAERARLSPSEKLTIERYLVTMAERPAAPE